MKFKKVLNLFIMTITLFIIGGLNVKADYTIDFSNADNRNLLNKFSYLASHYRVTTNNEIVYCYQPYVAYAAGTNYTGTLNYGNCKPISKNTDQLSYILSNGYGGTNAYSTGGSKFDDYYATQLAVWYFGDRTTGASWDSLGQFEVVDGKLTGKFNNTDDNITQSAAKLINDANDSIKGVSSISLEVEDTKLTFNSDKSYYVSKPIKITGAWVNKSVSVSASNVSEAFVTSDINATSGNTNFNLDDTIYVKVPAANINKEASVILAITGTSKKGNGTVNECQNIPTTASQKLIDLDGKPETIKSSITLTTNSTNVDVNISKQDITGSKEVKGATLIIKSGNEEIAQWVSDGATRKVSLAPGTYTLEETIAPSGYILSTSKITFTVTADGTVTVDGKKVDTVIMKNEPLYISISKRSVNGKTELSGAKLKITDSEGKLEKDLDGKSLIWISSTKEEKFHLAPGDYILTELEAPKGYELSDTTIKFTVTETGKVLYDKKEAEDNRIVFKNTPEPKQVPTGSTLIYILFLGVITAGVVTFLVFKRNYI